MEFAAVSRQDLPEIVRLNRQLIEDYEDFSSLDRNRVLGWMTQNLEENLPWFRKIQVGGRPAGYFCLKDGELDSLFVYPEFRRQGIGRAVVQYCQAQSPSLFLYVFRENTVALALYRRMGFVPVREAGTTRWIMQWKRQDSAS